MTSAKDNRRRWRARWLRGEFDKKEPPEKKDKNLEEFENKSKEVKNGNK